MRRTQAPRPFPTGVFLAAVITVCLGLAVSAGYTYSTFMRLRTHYLQNRGQEIAVSVDTLARGPGRRNNPEFWQSLIDESYQGYTESVAFFGLIDQEGRLLAAKGEVPSSASGYATIAGKGIYIVELPIATPRMTHFGSAHPEGGWRLRVGVYTSAADSIRRQALIELAVTLAAILMLLVLGFSQLRMLRHFLELKTREGSERHLRALGTMAAALAHEIRNPLGAMKGLTQLVQEDLPGDHPAQASIRTVIGEAERLERLVSDLLDFARPRPAKAASFDLLKLVSEVTAMLRPKIEATGIRLKLPADEVPLMVQSDEDGVRQILLNTMLNASEVTPPGGVIEIRTRLARKAREFVVEIDDSGQGLGVADPEELFQPFVTSKTRGTGLGLAISRQLAEGMGGNLTLENLARGGARCTLRIPQPPRP